MKLVIVHCHFRPGGVRRVIELAAPHLAQTLRPRIDEVVLAGGATPAPDWLARLQQRLDRVRVTCATEPALGYLSEQRFSPDTVRQRIRAHFQLLLAEAAPNNCLVWAHNLGLGRNLLLARELARLCADRHILLLAHHHDWWFDNRWQRWSEIRRAGFPSLAAVAETVFIRNPQARHIAINQADHRILTRHFPRQTGWLPNLMEPVPPLPAPRVRRARAWLRGLLGENAPVWLMPCRLLRRKNIAEALLLMRWLRPMAWLVTTGGVSSANERAYAARLITAAQHHGWRLRLGVLAKDEVGQPAVAELLAVSEAVLLTSLQEGFGLPYLEASAAHRPLLARCLPNVAPDLALFGFRFPQYYEELLVHPSLFDWPAECDRQRCFYAGWRQALPTAYRPLAAQPPLLTAGAEPHPVPFSRLTLCAQLEVLAQPIGKSWERCAPLNPFLPHWKSRAGQGALRVAPWPRAAAPWLSGRAYARRFQQIISAPPGALPPRAACLAAHEEFVRRTLTAENLYPLLWGDE